MNDVCKMEHFSEPKLVIAIYNFQPTNTDELCFQKDDIITVTQIVEGGWWEGTLRGVTGWFPSNYATEVKCAEKEDDMKSLVVSESKCLKRESSLNRHVVLQSLINTEKTFVSDLEDLLCSYLRPLENATILLSAEYTDLCGNLEDVASLHQTLLNCLQDSMQLPVCQQRIGGVFIQTAPQLQMLYHKYCANHPKAVAVLQSKKDELSVYMEGLGASSPGIMTLTANLSKPFRRVDRYSSLLKELERHTDEGHADRGDTQRAITVYRDIALSCTEIRKQKELEYEILHSDIHGWQGEEVCLLGEILLLSHVQVQTNGGDKKERLLLLFASTLVILSVTPRVSGYMFEAKIASSGIVVNAHHDSEDIEFAFEITDNSTGESQLVYCSSVHEKMKWLHTIKQHTQLSSICFTSKPHDLQLTLSHGCASSCKLATPGLVINSNTYNKLPAKMSMSCLRPCAPMRSITMLREDTTHSPRSARRLLGPGRRKAVDDAKILEDDALILRVIESYCTSTKARQTVNSSVLESAQVLIAEEEKIIVEETKGNDTVVEEKTLVDTVYSLKDQVRELWQEQHLLRKDLDNEKRARKRLENQLRLSLRSIVENTFESHDNTLINVGLSQTK